MTRDINTIKAEMLGHARSINAMYEKGNVAQWTFKLIALEEELREAESCPDMSAGPIDKAQYDTYHYRIDLFTDECLFVSDIEGPYQRGGEWFYHVTLWCDDRNTDNWRDSVSVNARHIVAVFDAKS